MLTREALFFGKTDESGTDSENVVLLRIDLKDICLMDGKMFEMYKHRKKGEGVCVRVCVCACVRVCVCHYL